MYSQDKVKIDVENRDIWFFGSARKPRILFFISDSRHIFVSDSWFCQIQTTRLLMFLLNIITYCTLHWITAMKQIGKTIFYLFTWTKVAHLTSQQFMKVSTPEIIFSKGHNFVHFRKRSRKEDDLEQVYIWYTMPFTCVYRTADIYLFAI